MTDPRHDDAWFDLLAGRPRPDAPESLRREAEGLRQVILADLAEARLAEAADPAETEAGLERMLFRLRREGLLDKEAPAADATPVVHAQRATAAPAHLRQRSWAMWGSYALAASLFLAVAINLVPPLISGKKEAASHLVALKAPTTGLDPDEARATAAPKIAAAPAADVPATLVPSPKKASPAKQRTRLAEADTPPRPPRHARMDWRERQPATSTSQPSPSPLEPQMETGAATPIQEGPLVASISQEQVMQMGGAGESASVPVESETRVAMRAASAPMVEQAQVMTGSLPTLPVDRPENAQVVAFQSPQERCPNLWTLDDIALPFVVIETPASPEASLRKWHQDLLDAGVPACLHPRQERGIRLKPPLRLRSEFPRIPSRGGEDAKLIELFGRAGLPIPSEGPFEIVIFKKDP